MLSLVVNRRLAVLDAPSNLGLKPPREGQEPGTRYGPSALRAHDLISSLGAEDAGVVTPPIYQPERAADSGVRNVATIPPYTRALAERVRDLLAAGRFPLVLGGDCSILPTLPDGVSDSVVVRLAFGNVSSDEGVGLIRFAAHQTRIELEDGSLRVDVIAQRGPPPGLTVKYDVTESGMVNSASIEFVRSTGDRVFENAVRAGVLRARFKAPTSNCRPIAQTVVQTFGR